MELFSQDDDDAQKHRTVLVNYGRPVKSYIADDMDENNVLASLSSVTLRSSEHLRGKRCMTNVRCMLSGCMLPFKFLIWSMQIKIDKYILGLIVIKQKLTK